MQAVRWSGFWAASVAIVLFVTTLAALPSFGAGAVPVGPNPPLGVHLSYLDDPTSATITWQTASPSSSRAEWGRSLGPPYASAAAGTDYTSPGGLYLHEATLSGLTPGAKYYYRVGDEPMTSTFGQGSFRAAPAKGSSDTFTFAAAGDWGNTTQTAATSNSIARRDPNFVLPLGDLYYAHDDATVGGVYQKWMTFGRGSFVQSAVGNHEVDEPGGQNTPTLIHCAFSNLPGNERTYSFTWGNAFFLTEDWGGSTSSKLDGVDGTPQDCTGLAGTTAIRTWVDAELAAANADPTIRWIIVYHHFPCYDTTTVGFPLLCPIDGGQDQIEDILVNRHVDLVLAGHDHTYGRTHPVHFGTVAQTGNAYDTPGAPMYFILGTGGASGRATCRSATWIAHCDNMITQRGYGWFQVTPTTIRYEFVENALGVIDSFTLKKSPAVGFAVSADPSAVHVGLGQAVSTNVTVLGASPDPVTLSSSDCPPAATCGFSPASGSPPFTSTLTVTTASSTPESIYRIDVTASNASASASAPLDVTVATQVTRTYQQGDGGLYSNTDDAYIYNGSVDGNFGSATSLFIDAQGCVISSSQFGCKSLIKFPQLIGLNDGQIPPGARIISATLQMRITNKGVTQDLYQEIENWDEATVTWNSFATPGFPMKADPVFTFKPNATGPISIDVTYVVQNWAVGDPNVGFFLTSTSGDGVIYDSSEAGTAANRPKLIVTYEKGPSLTNPVLSYDMETLTANGKMADLSGNGRHGTIIGTTDVAGEAGRARNFNGNGDRITAPAISVPATDFTVAAWFRWTTNPSPYYSGIHGGGFSWELRVQADGRLSAMFYQSVQPDTFTEITSPLAYNDGVWHHVAGVLRNGLVEIYVDGELKASDTTNPVSSVRPSTGVVIGSVASDFAGDIDEVRVYSRALTDSEIAAMVPPPPAGSPVLQYDMQTLLLDGRMRDLSGNVHHGTIAGTTDIAGKIGQARNFNGNGDRITAPAISVPATDFTVAAWFRWTTNPSPYYSGIHGGGFSWELRVQADGRFAIVFYQQIGPDVMAETASSLVYNDGEWHHAAGVLRAGLAELYVDGVLIAQDTTNPIASVRTSTQTVIGQVASDFAGDVDEVFVFSRALSAEEVGALASTSTLASERSAYPFAGASDPAARGQASFSMDESNSVQPTIQFATESTWLVSAVCLGLALFHTATLSRGLRSRVKRATLVQEPTKTNRFDSQSGRVPRG
jgi:hypothetical protein